MDSQKKIWERPELIIITRSTPEEMVLAWCKGVNLDWYASKVGGCAAAEMFDGTHWWCRDCRQGANS